MLEFDWAKEFGGAVTVCDAQGIILWMNTRAIADYKRFGGIALIGQNALDCHPEPARSAFARLLESQETNVYTIEKGRVKKLIYQAPWYRKGEYAGYIELSLEIPATMPHFVRDARKAQAAGD